MKVLVQDMENVTNIGFSILDFYISNKDWKLIAFVYRSTTILQQAFNLIGRSIHGIGNALRC